MEGLKKVEMSINNRRKSLSIEVNVVGSKSYMETNYDNDVDDYESPTSQGEDNFNDDDNDNEVEEVDMDVEGEEGRRARVLMSLPLEFEKGPVIFLGRVYVPRVGAYRYLLGYALYSLGGALEVANEEYCCKWRIEIIAVVGDVCEDYLVVLRYKLLQGDARLKGGLYKVERAVYDVVKRHAGYVNHLYGFSDDGEGRHFEVWEGTELGVAGHINE